MKINVRVVIITIVAMLLIMLFFNNIFAETTTSNNIAGNKTNITEDSDSSESTDNSDIKIQEKLSWKNYIVGNVRNDNLIDVSDAVDVLVIVANIYSWDFANSEAQDDYEIYQKLVEDGKISYNENIKVQMIYTISVMLMETVRFLQVMHQKF